MRGRRSTRREAVPAPFYRAGALRSTSGGASVHCSLNSSPWKGESNHRPRPSDEPFSSTILTISLTHFCAECLRTWNNNQEGRVKASWALICSGAMGREPVIDTRALKHSVSGTNGKFNTCLIILGAGQSSGSFHSLANRRLQMATMLMVPRPFRLPVVMVCRGPCSP
jgi:hypothetical protein